MPTCAGDRNLELERAQGEGNQFIQARILRPAKNAYGQTRRNLLRIRKKGAVNTSSRVRTETNILEQVVDSQSGVGTKSMLIEQASISVSRILKTPRVRNLLVEIKRRLTQKKVDRVMRSGLIAGIDARTQSQL